MKTGHKFPERMWAGRCSEVSVSPSSAPRTRARGPAEARKDGPHFKHEEPCLHRSSTLLSFPGPLQRMLGAQKLPSVGVRRLAVVRLREAGVAAPRVRAETRLPAPGSRSAGRWKLEKGRREGGCCVPRWCNEGLAPRAWPEPGILRGYLGLRPRGASEQLGDDRRRKRMERRSTSPWRNSFLFLELRFVICDSWFVIVPAAVR
ncbi:hypothetical protein DFH11DRAFT_1167703 [Phellopilus nigrolimitatus]|nr:hypothetical protein DFH11DRAFT_1167703 [Phellopilus nigrolimitatus]